MVWRVLFVVGCCLLLLFARWLLFAVRCCVSRFLNTCLLLLVVVGVCYSLFGIMYCVRCLLCCVVVCFFVDSLVMSSFVAVCCYSSWTVSLLLFAVRLNWLLFVVVRCSSLCVVGLLFVVVVFVACVLFVVVCWLWLFAAV